MATSTECTIPDEARSKPKAGSFISAKFEKLAYFKPDMVLLVSGQEHLAKRIEKHGFKTKILNNHTLSDISNNLRILGRLCNKDKEALDLANKFDSAVLDLSKILKNDSHPSLLFCIWTKPTICIGGNGFLNDVITICGAKNSTTSFKQSYPKLTAEKIISLDPELIILPHEVESSNLLTRPPWVNLKAVKSKQVFYLPEAKKDLLSRPSLEIISGLHWLASILHPEKTNQLDQWLKSNNNLTLNRDKP